MATPFLLIDGYNLMHAAGIARQRYGPGDLQAARQQLQRSLIGLLSTEALQRTTIVYDAQRSPAGGRRLLRHGGMTIRFAAGGGDADAEIEKLIRRHSAPRQLIVVSSDHRLQKAARRRRAKWIDSERFLPQLRRSESADVAGLQNDKPTSDVITHVATNDQPTTDELQRWADQRKQPEEAGGATFPDEYLDGLQQQIDRQQRHD